MSFKRYKEIEKQCEYNSLFRYGIGALVVLVLAYVAINLN